MVDTPEFNAQTTAADVLWAAVPLVGVCVCARAMASLRACVCSSIGTDVL
jgi:predicted O-linked N-acetylglucosamine transferase (SPINDLY family)